MATASKRKQAELGIQPSSKVTSPATADKLHVATRSDNVPLGSVLVLIRKSGHRTDKHLCQKDYDLAKEFATSYVRTHKASHINCNCKPEAHCIFANGVSSNLDISTLHQMAEMPTDHGRIVLIILQNDGLTTNALAFRLFFEPYRSMDLWLSIHYYDAVAEHRVNAYLDAITDWQVGQAGNTFPHGIVRIWVGVAINKEMHRQASTANKVLGLRPRSKGESYLGLSAKVDTGPIVEGDEDLLLWRPSPSFQHAVGKIYGTTKITQKSHDSVEACLAALKERLRQLGKEEPVFYNKSNKRELKSVEQEIPRNDQGKIVCTEYPRCDATFEDFPEFMQHITEVVFRLDKGKRGCLICFRGIVEPVGRKNVSDHVVRHFPASVECVLCHDVKTKTDDDMAHHIKMHHSEFMTDGTKGRSNHCVPLVNPHKTTLLRAVRTQQDASHTKVLGVMKTRIAVEQETEPISVSKYSDVDRALELNTTFLCSVETCSTELPTQSAIRKHMEEKHSVIVKCGVCSELVTEARWKVHKREHMPPVVSCDGCGIEVPSTTFQQYRRIFCEAAIAVEEDQEGQYRCHICHADFGKLAELREHRVQHQESSMIVQYAKDVEFPTHLITSLFRASVDPVMIGAQDEDSDVMLSTLANLQEQVSALTTDDKLNGVHTDDVGQHLAPNHTSKRTVGKALQKGSRDTGAHTSHAAEAVEYLTDTSVSTTVIQHNITAEQIKAYTGANGSKMIDGFIRARGEASSEQSASFDAAASKKSKTEETQVKKPRPSDIAPDVEGRVIENSEGDEEDLLMPVTRPHRRRNRHNRVVFDEEDMEMEPSGSASNPIIFDFD